MMAAAYQPINEIPINHIGLLQETLDKLGHSYRIEEERVGKEYRARVLLVEKGTETRSFEWSAARAGRKAARQEAARLARDFFPVNNQQGSLVVGPAANNYIGQLQELLQKRFPEVGNRAALLYSIEERRNLSRGFQARVLLLQDGGREMEWSAVCSAKKAARQDAARCTLFQTHGILLALIVAF